MMHVDRTAGREPNGLKRVRHQGLKHAERFFVDTADVEQRQQHYLNPYWERARKIALPTLGRLFRNKCAFCEQTVTFGTVDHFRPKMGDMNGRVDGLRKSGRILNTYSDVTASR